MRPPSPATTPSSLPARPPWLEDVALAAQHLARLGLATSAQAAALVTVEGRLWAYAGELPQPAAEELGRLAAHYWSADKSGEFVRFLRLEAVQQDYLLYATGLTADLVLALLFDVRVPFSRIRAQAGELASALTREAPPEAAMPSPPTGAPPEAEDEPPAVDEGAHLLDALLEDDLPPEAQVPLFDDVPPPTPEDTASSPVGTPPRSAAEPQPMRAEAEPPSLSPAPEAEVLPAAPTAPDTEVLPLPEPPTPSYAAVYYACVLAPRFPQHLLRGDLARDLSQWMPQIATALGWRLVHLAVRPTFLQWIVHTPPHTSPAAVLRAVRRHTSRRIFATYPQLAETNISGDFWAPGYLLLSRNQPIPAATIEAFLTETRRHQGLTPNP